MNPPVITLEPTTAPLGFRVVEPSFLGGGAAAVDGNSIARGMLFKNKSATQADLWPVQSIGGATDGHDKINDTSVVPLALLQTQPIISELDRLVVGALTTMLAHATLLFTCPSMVPTNVYLPHTIFDLESAIANRASLDRELAAFRNHTQQYLVAAFKTILQVLLKGFDVGTRFDRTVLQFVSAIDQQQFAASAQFTYSDHHVALARQYVYSALYDGQLLTFDSASLDNVCLSRSVEPAIETVTINVKTHQHVVQERPAKPVVEQTLDSIERKTMQVFQQHALLNRLITSCEKPQGDSVKQIVQQLVYLANDQTVWAMLRSPPLNYGSVKNVSKATRLCCAALTHTDAAAGETLQQLDRCGLFDDPLLLVAILDSGCLEHVEHRQVRNFLMNKLNQLDEQQVDELIGTDKDEQDKSTVKHILWLAFIAAAPLSRDECKAMRVKEDDAELTSNAVAMLANIYRWLEQNCETSTLLQARHKTVHNFLLRHRQYYLALVAQRRFQSIVPKTETRSVKENE